MIKLYYAKIANMGDLLNPLIIEKCFGQKVERESFLYGDMSAIGSCLAMYMLHGSPAMKIQQLINGFTHPKVAVWGTGFINYDDCKGRFFKRDMHFCAVRGELTRKSLEEITGKKLDIPTGDAGILADALLDEIPEKKHRIGIIPHLCDLKDENVNAVLAHYEDAVMINVKDDPIEVIKQIAECETVLSSSLHGLIVADSLGVPNRHLVFGDRLLGDGYKFDDYYSAYGVEHMITDLRTDQLPGVEEIKAAYPITKEMMEAKKQALRDCFPFKQE